MGFFLAEIIVILALTAWSRLFAILGHKPDLTKPSLISDSGYNELFQLDVER